MDRSLRLYDEHRKYQSRTPGEDEIKLVDYLVAVELRYFDTSRLVACLLLTSSSRRLVVQAPSSSSWLHGTHRHHGAPAAVVVVIPRLVVVLYQLPCSLVLGFVACFVVNIHTAHKQIRVGLFVDISGLFVLNYFR